MKTLFLVRHAKSSWDDPDMEDIERPLNGRGKKDAPVMGERLKARGILPGLILSSPAKRARSTAKRIAEEMGYPGDSIRVEEDLYEGDIIKLLGLVKKSPANLESLMFFGHNPLITEFANALCGINIYNIPTCGIVSIRFDIKEWSEADFKKGELVLFDYPKKAQNGVE